MEDKSSKGKLTFSQKIQQFKDYYLGGTLAALAVAALVIYMASRLLSPKESADLTVAVFDTDLSSEALQEMEQAVRASLNLPEEAVIVIDTGYVSSNTNEYTRLSLLSANGQVDAVIAGREVFGELAGFGYFKDLSEFLPEDMLSAYAGNLVSCAYESNAVAQNAQQKGELASGEYPFGLSIEDSAMWNSMTADSSIKPDKPVVGVILESENDSNVTGLLRVLMDQEGRR